MKLTKEQYNLKMKQYRDDNKLMNSYHCHNYKRRQKGFDTISVLEYLEYRKFINNNVINKLKSSRFSNFQKWEKHKNNQGLIFSEPVVKGNFTHRIKIKIEKEFS
jgi:hypothetical protein